MYQRSNL